MDFVHLHVALKILLRQRTGWMRAIFSTCMGYPFMTLKYPEVVFLREHRHINFDIYKSWYNLERYLSSNKKNMPKHFLPT